MNQAKIDTDEWMEVWRSTSDLENKYRELKTENQILNEWVRRLEFRIQKMEEDYDGKEAKALNKLWSNGPNE